MSKARGKRKKARHSKGDHLSPQRTFPFTRREGHRVGRPREKGSGVPHLTRAPLKSSFPVHVVLKIRRGLPKLRRQRPYDVLRKAFRAGCDKDGFRLNHYSVQGNHLHFIVEAKNREALACGMKGLGARIAKGLNKLWGRKGKVFADRYFDHILRTPTEVRNALNYVLKNAAHHGIAMNRPDAFSSGMWFDGWRELRRKDFIVSEPPCVAEPRTYLLRKGWLKGDGKLSFKK